MAVVNAVVNAVVIRIAMATVMMLMLVPVLVTAAVVAGHLLSAGFKLAGVEVEGAGTAAVADAADRKSTRLNSSHRNTSRMPSSA